MMIFNIHMLDKNLSGKYVLVFLRPIHISCDFTIHAWRKIKLSENAEASFCFTPEVSVGITVPGFHGNSIITSAIQPICTNQLFHAITPNGLSPKLVQANAREAEARIGIYQRGVRNLTAPARPINCDWYVSNAKVISMPFVDADMTATFSYEPVFYFRVVAPYLCNDNIFVQSFTDMVSYKPSDSCSLCDIKIDKIDYRWTYEFIEREPDPCDYQ